jgi:hypothetical protein
MPVEILGQVYEQFLGKVIRLTAGHRAKVEEKPEVRKAGGVYYTPQYIVDYIVKNTVGELLRGNVGAKGHSPNVETTGSIGANGRSPQQGLSPKEIESLKILDPACGSGSFLIGAFTYLLNYHLDWYIANGPEKYPKAVFRDGRGAWRLTTQEAKKILLNNIYGVDIDSQAVEVTKLSLLLKVLENESKEGMEQQLKMFKERALPNIDGNIKCGNSLIGSDFYDGEMDLGDEERKKINAFDWKREFPEIMNRGGFNAVIGNPPYGAELSKPVKEYLSNKYSCVSDYETSQYFIINANTIVRTKGHVAFIVPNTLFVNLYANKFRNYITTTYLINKIANYSNVDVFKDATVRTVIPFLIKGDGSINVIEIIGFKNELEIDNVNKIKQIALVDNDRSWVTCFTQTKATNILANINNVTVPLSSIIEASQGLIPYDKYRGHDANTIKNRIWNANTKKNKTYKRELRGGDVTRYSLIWNGKQWISYGPWLAAPRRQEFFTKPRLLFREITDPKSGLLHVAYTDDEYYNNPGIINCISRGNDYSLLYLLGIANSRLISYLHFSSSPKARKGVFPKILVKDVRDIRIRAINFKSADDIKYHDKMISLVAQMLSLKNKLPIARTPHEKEALQRQINATDQQIDRLVYELYGLTEKEISLLEINNEK